MAKHKEPVITNSYTSGTDQTAETAQNRFQKLNAGKVEQSTVAGSAVFGLLLDDPNIDDAALLAHGGIVQIQAGAAVAVDTPIMTDVTGRAVAATIGLQTVGKTLDEAAAAAGELITCLLFAGNDITP